MSYFKKLFGQEQRIKIEEMKMKTDYKQLLADHLGCNRSEIKFGDGLYWRDGSMPADPNDESWLWTLHELRELQE